MTSLHINCLTSMLWEFSKLILFSGLTPNPNPPFTPPLYNTEFPIQPFLIIYDYNISVNILLQNWSISVNARVWLPARYPASVPLWGRVNQSPRGSAHNPRPLQAPTEQIKAWHWFEIASLCVTYKTKQAVSRKSTMMHFKQQAVRAAIRTGVSTEKSW